MTAEGDRPIPPFHGANRKDAEAACRPILLTSAYLAPVQYYTKLYSGKHVVEERGDRYLKQTYRNRCLIATPAGPLALSIPIEHGGNGQALTRDIRLSNHGKWRSEHWHALRSYYGESPFFDYYADDLHAIYKLPLKWLVDFNEALEQTVCNLLGICPNKSISLSWRDAAETDTDLRGLSPKRPVADTAFRPAPYYQVFVRHTGFLPNLSIVDLLFNMGPESRLVLRNSISAASIDSPP